MYSERAWCHYSYSKGQPAHGGLIKKNMVHELQRRRSLTIYYSSVFFCPYNLCRNWQGVREVHRLQERKKRIFNRNRSKSLLFHNNFSRGTLNSNAGNFEKINSRRVEESMIRRNHQTISNIIISTSTCQWYTLVCTCTRCQTISWKDMIPTLLENLCPLPKKGIGPFY